MELTGALERYVARLASTDFDWGGPDCQLSPADWALARTGVDPAAAWRGAYHDEAGARAIVEQAGGLLALMGAALEGAGWVRTDAPKPGDIGAVEVNTPRGRGLVGAVRNDRFWIVRTPRGVGMVLGPAEAAWTPVTLD